MLEARLAQRGQLAALLLAEPNVQLFDFQNRKEWTQNYDLYFDSIHYVSCVNDAMAHAMAADECRVTDVSQVEASSDALRADCLALYAEQTGKEHP